MELSLKSIRPNPINDTIYEPTNLDDLKDSIKSFGLLEPITCDKDLMIISGHRRYYSLVQLGKEKADVRVVDFDKEGVNKTIALIESNRSRIKSVHDILNEARVLQNELKKEFGGQGRRNDKGGKTNRYVVVNEVAKKLNIGSTNLKKIIRIEKYKPELLDLIDRKEISINKAEEIIKKEFFPSTKPKADKDQFDQKFKDLLNDYKPTKDQIFKVLSQTHPYSLEDYSTSDKSVRGSKKKDLSN
tara:strand:+ start:1092 stop:1823 length:732 start_codon:yes stop_codon:yes gene_type:complete